MIMLDNEYYANKYLGLNANKWLKYFNKNNYKSINSLIYTMENIDLSWIKHYNQREELQLICNSFAIDLKNERLNFKQLIDIIEHKTFNLEHTELSSLELRGYTHGICPSCGKKELFIPKQGQAMSLVCNRKNNCGYASHIYTYLKEFNQKTSKEALEIMAEMVGSSIEEINYENEVHKASNIVLVPKKKQVKATSRVESKEIDYLLFDFNKKAQIVDFKKYLPSTVKYTKLNDIQKWKVFVTAIYNFSLNTKQWGKDNYFSSIGISIKKAPLLSEKVEMIKNKLGFLHIADIKNLLNYLLEDCKFSVGNLVEYGLLVNSNSRKINISIEEGLVVIPNFDMYTNMVTGLKFRKTKLKTWLDKKTNEMKIDKNKEPEFSYKRIANPLPYHLTRESLLDKTIIFRFFEGQKDLHSMPSKNGYCDIAIPGISGINESMLGLFKGRVVEIYFDQDDAGQKGAQILKYLLESAGAIVINKKWDISLGTDINEVLQNGNILKLI